MYHPSGEESTPPVVYNSIRPQKVKIHQRTVSISEQQSEDSVLLFDFAVLMLSVDMSADMIFVKSFTQAYTLTFRNLPEENA